MDGVGVKVAFIGVSLNWMPVASRHEYLDLAFSVCLCVCLKKVHEDSREDNVCLDPTCHELFDLSVQPASFDEATLSSESD